MYAHNKYAPTNIRAPEPIGICRRCGFVWPLAQLVAQYQWMGPSLGKILTRVCIKNCLDEPNEQLRTIYIDGDPKPIFDASPTFYAQQNAAASTSAPTQVPPLQDDGGFGNIQGPGSILGNPPKDGP